MMVVVVVGVVVVVVVKLVFDSVLVVGTDHDFHREACIASCDIAR